MSSRVIAKQVLSDGQWFYWKVDTDAYGNDIPPGQYVVSIGSDQSDAPFSILAQ